MFKKRSIATLAPHVNATSIYTKSRAQKKYLIKEPEWDISSDNLLMKAIHIDRDLAEVIQQQEKLSEEAKNQNKQNKKRVEELRKIQAELRNKFIESNNFICECEKKEAELDKKIAAEKAEHERLQKEMNDYDERIKNIRTRNEEEVKPAIKELSIYEDILQEVVDASDLFKTKKDFIDRVEALLLAQKEVEENETINLEEFEKMQAEMAKTSNEITVMMAGYENKIAELEKTYEKSKQEYLKWEGVVGATKSKIIEKEKEAFMMIDQIRQLYLLFCKRSGEEPKLKLDQVEEQLDFIKQEIEITMQIIEMANEMTELETRSDIAECGSGKSGKPRK